MAKKLSDKKHLDIWSIFRDNMSRSTPVDIHETEAEKKKRIAYLEANPEKWFEYYFPNFCKNKPAVFHLVATKRVLENGEWFEVRSWARGMAKSARTMMEVLYLSFTRKKKTWLMVSNTEDNAIRLLAPYKNVLEANNRIINDYGIQKQVGKWDENEFTSKFGFSFRALGEGQSPRGTRNDATRPDGILIDDFDTDEKCRNKERVKNATDWLLEAVFPTRDDGELLIIVNGNIIAKYCTITILGELADCWDVVNLTDKQGNPNWEDKYPKETIKRMFYNSKGKRKISKKAEQKEYYNNPNAEGDTFKIISYGKCPPIKNCEKVVVYADPSPSNNVEKKNSYKAVIIIGLYNGKYYIYKVWLGKATNSDLVKWLGKAYKYLERNGIDTKKMWIENNSFQDPHYQQVLKPLLEKFRKAEGYKIPLREDKRKKADKFERIEGMADENNDGDIIFNQEEKDSPMMVEMEDQWLGVSAESKEMDGPDAVEGGKWIIDNKAVKSDLGYASGQVEDRKY
ncbi:hypothetical protein BAS06_09410 [Elizabethkingia miricola]|uniref:hypothetical protein n=1 Tax=Elizabethkingia miricola TaxID=172045 RepID=UPI00099A342E|nr:hypothetical protein [Elizabethkingia miricola]MDV3880731.1 hypothetical protein [Elizabethkingia anophelis]OPB90525.1 hypothetical protein BAS06_09410 [Elizabethkingia miricola]